MLCTEGKIRMLLYLDKDVGEYELAALLVADGDALPVPHPSSWPTVFRYDEATRKHSDQSKMQTLYDQENHN